MNFWEKESITYEEVLQHFFSKRNFNIENFDLSKNYSEYDGIVTELFSEDEFTDILEKEILSNYKFHDYDKDDVKDCGILSDIAENISDYEDKKDIQEYIDDNIDEYIDDAY